jgi:hypothetical protein
MSDHNEKASNDDLSLAVVGLLTAAIVTIFLDDGDFSLFVVLLGVILLFIGHSFSKRLSFDKFGFVAFCLVQGAAFLCISGYFIELYLWSAGNINFEIFHGVSVVGFIDMIVWIMSAIVYGYYRYIQMGGVK